MLLKKKNCPQQSKRNKTSIILLRFAQFYNSLTLWIRPLCINALKMTFMCLHEHFPNVVFHSVFLSLSVRLRLFSSRLLSGLSAFSLNNITLSDVQLYIWSFGWTCQFNALNGTAFFTYRLVFFYLFVKQTRCTKYKHFSSCVFFM